MKTRMLPIFLAAVCLTVVCGCSKDDDDIDRPKYERKADCDGGEPRYDLRQSYRAGKYRVTYDTSTKQNISAEKEKSISTSATQTLTMLLNVSEPDPDGAVTVVLTVERVQINQNGKSIDTDTEDEVMSGIVTPDPFREMALAIKSMRLIMKQAPDGSIMSVEGLEDLWNELASRLPQSSATIDQMKKSFNDETIKEMCGMHMAYFPDHPVGKGAVWHNRLPYNAPFLGEISVDSQMELVDVKDTPTGKIATIKANSEIEMPKNKDVELSVANVTIIDGYIFQACTMELDMNTGMVDVDLSQTGDIKMSVSQGKEEATARTKLTQIAVVKTETVE